jgi:Rod binding domain-containing protein
LSQIKNTPSIHIKRPVQEEKYRHIPKDYMRVAEGMEAQFTNHLLGEMRKTIHSVDPETQDEKIYKSMLDNERSDMMAKSNSGLGIKDLVLDQIYPKHRRVPQDQGVKMYNKLNSQKGESNE